MKLFGEYLETIFPSRILDFGICQIAPGSDFQEQVLDALFSFVTLFASYISKVNW